MWKKDETICSVDGCWRPVRNKGWCNKHYLKLYKSASDYRPSSGEKRKHKLYSLWFERKQSGILCKEWLNFDEFIKGIEPKPEGNYFLIRLRNEPFGPDNFKWQLHLRKQKGESNKAWWARKWASRQGNFPGMERARSLKRYFGMTVEKYEELFKNQNGRCAICKKEETSTDGKSGTRKKLAVDHCHVTKEIRGLLCSRCNTTLGKAEDNVELLQAMIDYLNTKGR